MVGAPFIDEIYACACEHGALGGKVTGAGGGGYMLLFCDPSRREVVAKQVRALGTAVSTFRFEPEGLVIYERPR